MSNSDMQKHPRLLMVTTIAATLRAFLLPFADYFRARGWRVDAMASGVSNCGVCKEHFDQVFEVQWTRNPMDFFSAAASVRKVKLVAQEGGYDLVHVHTPVAAFLSRFALRRTKGLPQVIYTAHGFHFHPAGSAWKNRLFEVLEHAAGKWTDHLITINQTDFQAAIRLGLLQPMNVSQVPGIGVNILAYSADAVSSEQLRKLRKELGIPISGEVFLQVGEFLNNKRQRDTIEAFSKLKIPATLLLAGAGPLEDAMRKLAKELGVENRVKFLGLRSDIPVLLQLADIVVLTSQREGLPRCILEAMAAGKPVIGSDIRGIRDLVQEGCGMLYPVGDTDALAAAMEHLGGDPDKRRRLGDAGLRAITKYDIGNVISEHEKIYHNVLAGQSRGQRANC